MIFWKGLNNNFTCGPHAVKNFKFEQNIDRRQIFFPLNTGVSNNNNNFLFIIIKRTNCLIVQVNR